MTSTPRIPRLCRARACTAFTTNTSGRCDQHQAEKRRAYHQQTAYYHTPEWAALRKACLARDHDQCVICAGTRRLTAHHIRPRSEGGRDHLDNLVTVCGDHHSSIEQGNRADLALLRQHLVLTGRILA